MEIMGMKNLIIALSIAVMSIGCAKEENTLESLSMGSLALAPKTMSIRIKNYKPQIGNSFQHLFVLNYSVSTGSGMLEISTARDGMSDALKNQVSGEYGFSTTSSESILTGFSDLFLFQSGLKLGQHSLLNCVQNQTQTSSFDAFIYQDERYLNSPTEFLGLRDCVKNYMGLNPTKFDYDSDGIPDNLEIRFGLNPKNGSDAYLSLTGDGVMNIDKVKRNIPIDESANSQPNQLFAYKYETILNPDSTRDFVISNIPVLNDGKENFIAFNLVEVNIANHTESLYTAYMILEENSINETVEVDYWATSPTNFLNVKITGQ